MTYVDFLFLGYLFFICSALGLTAGWAAALFAAILFGVSYNIFTRD